MVHRLIATLLLPLAVTSCGRTLRSCAAYIVIVGPTAMTITCPPTATQVNETTPDDTVTLRQPPLPVPPQPPPRKGKMR